MAYRTRRKRRQTKGRFRLHKPRWVDPYPSVPGTEPEKRVFAALRQRNIYFIFQGQIPSFEKGNPLYFMAPANYKPDFVLPEYRLIIDPFGVFHHSLKGAAESDRNKIARYASAGYAYYHPWFGVPGVPAGTWVWSQTHNLVNHPNNRNLRRKFRVITNRYGNIARSLGGNPRSTNEMLDDIPELRMGPRHPLLDPRDIAAKRYPGYRIGENLGAGANSVAAANRTRRKPKNLVFRARR